MNVHGLFHVLYMFVCETFKFNFMCITMQTEDCTVIMIFLYMTSVFEMKVIYCKSRFKLIY